MAPIQYIVPADLTDLPKRVLYTSSFLSFTEADGKAIEASGPLIAPLLQDILNGIYSHLLSFDITAKAFLPKTANDSEHDKDAAKVEDLTLEHGHIGRQMNFLRNYLLKIVSNKDWTPESKLFLYMNQVGVMHTGAPGFKYREKRPEVRVEYMHMGILLGHVVNMLIDAVMDMENYFLIAPRGHKCEISL